MVRYHDVINGVGGFAGGNREFQGRACYCGGIAGVLVGRSGFMS